MMYEYKIFSSGVLKLNDYEIEKKLNELGKSGWELIAVYNEGVFVFIRPLGEEERRLKVMFGEA